MKAGSKIHALVESGLLEVLHRFNMSEKELVVMLDNGVKVLGKPDSHEEGIGEVDMVSFVDYKTGKENHWTKEELATDLKMRLTAWLVFRQTPSVSNVRAIIEWIGTEWNGEELVPTNEPHECVEYVFTRLDMVSMDATILSTIEAVNEEYEKFLKISDEDLVEEADVLEYAALDEEKKKIEKKQDEIKERIAAQLDFTGKSNYEHPLGSFYFTTKKTYEYPYNLKIYYRDYGLVLEDAEEIGLAVSSAKKMYELDHDPIKVTKSLGFRAKKVK